MARRLDLDARLEQQYRRLGRRDAICVTCGESNVFCLELHHIAGRKHHDDLSILCRNCHRKLSDAQRDHPDADVLIQPGDSQIGHYLLGLSDLLALVSERQKIFGEWLLGARDRGSDQ
jgi:hypothetical protein